MRDVAAIKELLQNGQSVDFSASCTLLHRKSDVETLELALRLDPSLAVQKNPLGETLLMKSVGLHNIEAVQLLLNHKSRIDEQDNRGFTPLCYAIVGGSKPIVEMLIEHGADVNIPKKTTNPLILALKWSDGRFVDILILNGVQLSVPERLRHFVLIRSIIINHTPLLRKLLQQEAFVVHVNDRDVFGKTPLVYACEHGNELIVRALLETNALTLNENQQGRAAYSIAVQNNHSKITEILDKYGYTPKRSYSIDRTNAEYPKSIFSAFNDEPNQKAISNLIRKASPESLNCTDEFGNTLLHLAAKYKCEKVIFSLLDRGVDRDAVNNEGKTALNIAAEHDSKDIYVILSLFKPKVDSLKTLIENGDYYQVKRTLKSYRKVCAIDIFTAVCNIDSDVPDPNEVSSLSSLHMKILRTMIFDSPMYDRKKLIDYALKCAFALNKFKVVRYFWIKGLSGSVVDFIKREKSRFIISFEMIDYLNEMYEFNSFPMNNEVDPDETIAAASKRFYLQPLSWFIYVFTSWKANDYRYKGFELDDNTLKTAINFRREDIATVLVQQGPNWVLDKRHEDLIKSNFSRDFVALYGETKFGRLKTQEEFARIAVRCDLPSFHQLWSSDILRSIMEYQSKSYEIDCRDENGCSALCHAYDRLDCFAAECLIREGAVVDELVKYKIESMPKRFKAKIRLERFRNPLLNAIKNEDVDALTKLERKFDLNDYYNASFNALHYSVVCASLDFIKVLVKFGCKDVLMKSAPYCSCRDLARILRRSEVDSYLSSVGFVCNEEEFYNKICSDVSSYFQCQPEVNNDVNDI